MTRTKITIEEAGRDPVVVSCEAFALVHIGSDHGDGVNAELVASDKKDKPSDAQRGDLLAVAVVELAVYIEKTYPGSRSAKAMAFFSKVGARILGLTRNPG